MRKTEVIRKFQEQFAKIFKEKYLKMILDELFVDNEYLELPDFMSFIIKVNI